MSTSAPKRILLVEDDSSLNKLLVSHLCKIGYETTGVTTGAQARAHTETPPDLIILDIRLPDCSGFDLLVEFASLAPTIMMTAHGAVDQAVKAVRTGATDYLVKPITFEALEFAVTRAFETVELKRDLAYWQSQAQRGIDDAIIGNSPELAEMRNLIELYSVAGPTVLIEGESGTGKELVARSIHAASDRADGRFIPVDCDPSQEQNIVIDLFGYDPGAFPGAETRREGMLEFADQGTIYLSDIAEISQALQSRILRVLETGSFRRQGGTEDVKTNVRIIAGTSHDLHALVEAGRFRSEFYFLLSAFRIRVPALRERRSDIIDLSQHFLNHREFQRGAEKELSSEAVEALSRYDWPGNVRELRNAIERGVIVSGDAAIIQPYHLACGEGASPSDDKHLVVLKFASEPTMEELRDVYLQLLLDRHDGNRRAVAKVSGISERNTYRLISKLFPQ